MMTSSQVELWPANFSITIVSQKPLLREVMEWTKSNTPPMCVFMPDRLADATESSTNSAQFEAFASLLLQNQFVSLSQLPHTIQSKKCLLVFCVI